MEVIESWGAYDIYPRDEIWEHIMGIATFDDDRGYLLRFSVLTEEMLKTLPPDLVCGR